MFSVEQIKIVLIREMTNIESVQVRLRDVKHQMQQISLGYIHGAAVNSYHTVHKQFSHLKYILGTVNDNETLFETMLTACGEVPISDEKYNIDGGWCKLILEIQNEVKRKMDKLRCMHFENRINTPKLITLLNEIQRNCLSIRQEIESLKNFDQNLATFWRRVDDILKFVLPQLQTVDSKKSPTSSYGFTTNEEMDPPDSNSINIEITSQDSASQSPDLVEMNVPSIGDEEEITVVIDEPILIGYQNKETGSNSDSIHHSTPLPLEPQENVETLIERNQSPIQSSGVTSDNNNDETENSSDYEQKSNYEATTPKNKRSRWVKALKEYICPICEAITWNKANMKKHHRTNHMERKPYQCPGCWKKFAEEDEMREHEPSHLVKGLFEEL